MKRTIALLVLSMVPACFAGPDAVNPANKMLPIVMPDGIVMEDKISGNSYAGPMLVGTIALMLSADPELLPWDAREIILASATDVGPPGVDFENGHGLINCHKAVGEVLRRKKHRESE
jgi:subtilisin family serine protease